MANARTTDREARLIEQMARGRRSRYVYSVPLIIATDRATIDTDSHLLADAIRNDTGGSARTKAVFAAPCGGKVVRIYTNASTYPTAAAGTFSVKATKAVIGDTDVDLCSALDIRSSTAETAVDATLSTVAGALNLITGQLVYATLDISNNAITAKSENLTLNLEFVPTDWPW